MQGLRHGSKTQYCSNSLIINRIKSLLIVASMSVMLMACGGGDSGTTTAPSVTDDKSPNTFTFSDIIGASLSTEIKSNFVVIDGINIDTPISITEGLYAITGVNGSVFTDQAGIIKDGQRVQVKLTTQSGPNLQSNAVLTIGDKSDTFSVTTSTTGNGVNITPTKLTLSENEEQKSFDIVLTAKPNGSVIINLNNPDTGEVVLDKSVITFDTQFPWDTPQTITATGVNDKILDDVQIVNITLAIDPASTDSSGYKNLTTAGLPQETITINDNGVAGLSVVAKTSINTTTGNITIRENGGSGIFDVKLTSQPTIGSSIEVTITSNLISEANVLPTTLTFDSNNWATAKPVTVIGIKDGVVDADKTVVIAFSISNTTSDKTGYSAVNPQSRNVLVTNVDVAPGVNVTVLGSTNLTETAAGSFVDLEIALQSQPESVNNPLVGSVTINVDSLTPDAVLVENVASTSLTFTQDNWKTAQPIRVSSIDNKIAYGNTVFTVKVSVSASTDARYTALVEPLDGADVLINVADNDVAGVIVTPINLGNITEGKTKTFLVKLNSEPIAPFSMDVLSSLPGQARVSSGSLSFTKSIGVASYWNTAQLVTVSGVKDGIVDADTLVNINLNISATDSDYNPGLNKRVLTTIINTNVVNNAKDASAFLQYLNKSAPRNNETVTVGAAYYAAVDPNNKRLSLTTFKSFNKLQSGVDANGLANVATYVNDVDLGFGRRMYVSVNKKTSGAVTRVSSIASCVENFAPAAGVNAAAQIKLDLAKANNHGLGGGLIATVCMEYSGTPGSPSTAVSSESLTGRKFVKFFTYLADGSRINQVDLDGRGVKTQPGLCTTCHGGQGNSLISNANGTFTYPSNGDTSSQFLPWDLDTLVFDSTPGFTQVDYEPVLKRFNEAVLATYPQPRSFSFTGNLIIPTAIVPEGTKDAAGNFVPVVPSVTTSTITVNTVSPIIITDFVLSIDDDGQGGPGITYNTGKFLGFKLISPGGKIFYPNTGFSSNGIVNASSGVQNLYFSDDGEGRYFDQVGGPSLVNGVISGTIFGVSHGFVNNTECINNLPQVPSPTFSGNDIGCTDANGVWKLEVSNRYVGTGRFKAWSLHFNGVPDGAYTPAPVELVRGWYGGKALPLTNFDGQYIPEGWKAANNPTAIADPELLYLDVIGPTCRACHVQRGTMASNTIDFASYKKFMAYADRTQRLVYDKGIMPMAKRTFENHFWNSTKPAILAQHMPGNLTNVFPGRNIPNAGFMRTGNYSVAQNQVVTLNGSASLFPAGYKWTVTGPNNLPVALTVKPPVLDSLGKPILNPLDTSFTTSLLGQYQVTLDTSGIASPTLATTATTVINSSATIVPVSFKNTIVFDADSNGVFQDANGLYPNGSAFESALSTCSSSRCHGGQVYDAVRRTGRMRFITANGATPPTLTEQKEDYRILRDRINTFLPQDSMTIIKGLNGVRHGGKGRYIGRTDRRANWTDTGTGIGKMSYDYYLRWILEGANFN